ncbi:glycosyltransferase family 2 protein, partial [Candidatus Woesearchaeota archaeon]|nr:glycosyltransferase family 2 protein [Candidatus Woesearchaeota archaeon]
MVKKSEKKPRVTVIMSAYNSEKYVEEAVDSILKQTFKDF